MLLWLNEYYNNFIFSLILLFFKTSSDFCVNVFMPPLAPANLQWVHKMTYYYYYIINT